MNDSIRRIVTEHDNLGRSVFRSEDSLETTPIATGDANMALVWTTATVPADNNGDVEGDKRSAGVTLHGGTVIRVTDMRPGCSSPMHRSHSIDYGIILSGELELELDSGQTTRLRPGDIVVQRGTNHLWRNPSETEWCRIVFILIEAAPVKIDSVEVPESSTAK
jgi:quercetin dioxygenase-like cupin family protein